MTDRAPALPRPTVRRVWAAELRRLCATTWVRLAVTATIAAGLAVGGLSASLGANSLTQGAVTTDPVFACLVGTFLVQVLIAGIATKAVTEEYPEAIGTTLLVVPQRGRVLAGKTAAILTLTVAAAVTTGAGSLLLGSLIYGDHLPPDHLLRLQPVLAATGGLAPPVALAGLTAYLALVAVLAVGLAFLTRSTLGSMTIVIALCVGARVVNDTWRSLGGVYRLLAAVLPAAPGELLWNGARTATSGERMLGGVTLAVWAVSLLALGALRFLRSDA